MLNATTSPNEKRRRLREELATGRVVRVPGAMNPLTAVLIQELGFEGVYVSGAVIAAELALPDIGLTTLTEVAGRGHQIARVTDLPTVIDADTGFGEPMNTARTVQSLEEAGLAGCHLEDQVNPKRCGHLDGKTVVDTDTMVRRVRAAVTARRDDDFVVCARTDAAAVEGLDSAIDRAKAYVDAGADMVFPEAMRGPADLEAFRRAVDVPLLVNMTEFGKSELLTVQQLESLGMNMVIYPVTALRLAMGAVEDGLRSLREEGTQVGSVDRMQTRKRLYELLDYPAYNTFDNGIHNFTL